MRRALTTHNIYEKNYNTYPFKGVWHDVLGEPSTGGLYLNYGKEKNGKTWGALLLAKEFVRMGENVLYITAEEGYDKAFQDACVRAQMPVCRRLKYLDYEPIAELEKRLKKRNAPSVVFLDNATAYSDELKRTTSLKLSKRHPNTTFVVLAHEERGEPFTSAAKWIKKFAKIIIHTEGLQMQISGRCPGGVVNINEEKALIYHGN